MDRHEWEVESVESTVSNGECRLDSIECRADNGEGDKSGEWIV